MARPRVRGRREGEAHLRRDGPSCEPPRPSPGRSGREAGGPRGYLRAQPRGVGGGPVGHLQDSRGVDQHQLSLRRGRTGVSVRQRRSDLSHRGTGVRRSCARRATRPAAVGDRTRVRGSSGRAVGRAGLRGAQQRRHLHALHRRHHRHAQGRGVASRGRGHGPGRWRRHHHRCADDRARTIRGEGTQRFPSVRTAHRPAHARRHAMERDGPEFRGQQGDPARQVRSGRRVPYHRDRESEPGDDHRRCHGPTDAGPSRRQSRPVRPVVAVRRQFQRGVVLAGVQGPVHGHVPQHRSHRRRGLQRGRRQRHHHGGQGCSQDAGTHGESGPRLLRVG